MKFDISRASELIFKEPPPYKGVTKKDGYWQIEINTLEELIAISVDLDEQLIIDKDSIIIYDDYME